LPQDLLLFSHSVVAASLSASNFFFWKTSNYFDAPAAVKPLLHTWSLGVEEQFYLFLPAFLVVFRRCLRNRLYIAIWLVALGSFVWSVIDVRVDPGAAFYLPFTRTWELLTGTIIAIPTTPLPLSKILRECIASLGAVGIAASVFILTQNTPFPGAYALLPCLSTAAVILAGQQGTTLVGRLLSLGPIAFVGVISYSLYLWHWTLLVFGKIAILKNYDVTSEAIYVLIPIMSFIMAYISWRFIETPFRKGPRRPTKSTVFKFGVACVLVSCSSALLISSTDGMVNRFSTSTDALGSYLDYGTSYPDASNAVFEPHICFLDRGDAVAEFDTKRCLAFAPGKTPVLIFGDSHAENLYYGLKNAFPKVHFLRATSSACPPTLDQGPGSSGLCKEFVAKVLNDYIPRKSITMVLLNASWGRSDLDRLTHTIDLLHDRGVHVILFGPLPEYDIALPRLLIKSNLDGKIDYAPEHLQRMPLVLDDKMRWMAKEAWAVPYVSLITLLCPATRCLEYAAPGVPLEFDNNHLTLQGSVYLGRKIEMKYPNIFAQGFPSEGDIGRLSESR